MTDAEQLAIQQNTLGLALVCGAMMLESFGQICFKKTADRSVHGVDPLALLRHAWKHYWLFLGIACFLIEAMVWTLALRKLPISIAFPAGSICFVFVALLSRAFLREKVGAVRWGGIALILAGVLLVSVRIP
jgi:drug/metabolite transporter (DMT)-like permease